MHSNEAQQITKMNYEDRLSEAMEEIYRKINKAAVDGRSSIWLYRSKVPSHLKEEILERLKENGYNIATFDSLNASYKIKW